LGRGDLGGSIMCREIVLKADLKRGGRKKNCLRRKGGKYCPYFAGGGGKVRQSPYSRR